jgi:hypothetical protein
MYIYISLCILFVFVDILLKSMMMLFMMFVGVRVMQTFVRRYHLMVEL